MHDTALLTGKYFSELYGNQNFKVVDIGGQDVNGSLRSFFESNQMDYISVDLFDHPSVDIVVKPYEKLPFESGSVDIVVSTSCFEHDPCFWITFKEMCRIVRLGGYIYINAPSNGSYHKYPGDNWRFYSDAGQALSFWSGKKMDIHEDVYPVKVVETFHVLPLEDHWIDFVAIFERVDFVDDEIVVREEVSQSIGKLRKRLHENGVGTDSKVNASSPLIKNKCIDNLDSIFSKYDTDKNIYFHSYTRQYDKLLSFYRTMPLKFLEIGVYNGGSLSGFREAFQNAQLILGIDINFECKRHQDVGNNIYVEIGDATSDYFIKFLTHKYGTFDIILDDGSHSNKDVIHSFELLFPLLNDDGLYIVEDTVCYKCPQFVDNSYEDHLQYFYKYTKFLNQWRYDSEDGIIDNCVDPFKIKKKTDNVFEYSIDKIEYGCSYVAIHKKIKKHWIKE